MRKHLAHMSKKIKKKKGHLKNILLLGAGLFLVFFSFAIIWVASLKIPDFNSLEDRKILGSTKIYDRTGEILLYDIHEDIKRTNVPLAQISDYVQKATISIEDSEFYTHNGIRVTSILRAVLSNITGVGIGGGGSTITQQLVKNTLLTQSSGFGKYVRKIKEWFLAIKIDKSFSKDRILELYLNESPYGGTIYGIEEASKEYFGKSAVDLTLAEAAYLSSIPQSPTYLSPYGKNTDKLAERKNLVLFRMKELGYINEEEYNQAKDEEVVFKEKETRGIKAPHFVFFIKDYLEKKYGADVIEKGGLKVTTTLDYELQEKAEEIAKEEALKNEKDWNGKNVGIVAIEPKTGQILTMVGSRDYFDKEIDGNFNITTASRQPGSSFKPFIYATAFKKGFTPDTVLFDLPTEFQTTCNAYGVALPGKKQSDCYSPENFDGKYKGPISLRSALAESRNIPAVKLFYLSGLSDSLKTAESMGISTLTDVSRYGLTLVIGGGEVTLLDITSAYSVFANAGYRNPYTGILKVENEKGDLVEGYRSNGREVLPKNVALTVSDVLSDNNARIPTFGASSSLYIKGYDVAAKTGTTNNNKDAWLIGYSPNIAVGVWAGNNDNTPMKKGGSAVAGPTWNKFMNFALTKFDNEKFEEPITELDPKEVKPVLRGFWQGNENFFIDKVSGKLATEYTPKETTQEKVITNVHSILYWVDRNDITGLPPANPDSNAQFSHWEIPVQEWWSKNWTKYPAVTWNDRPIEYDDVHTSFSKPSVFIVEPNENSVYKKDQRVYLKILSSGQIPIGKIDVFINNTFIGTSNNPYNFSFLLSELDNIQNVNEIKVISYDTAFNKTESVSYFKAEE